MTQPRNRELVLSRLWQRLADTGLERFELVRDAGAWSLAGTILAFEGRDSYEAVYEIWCDAEWRTVRADIGVRSSQGARALNLTVSDGRWYENGVEKEAVRGCVDVDLSWTPSTNTLPIRRLGLGIGARSGTVVAAWVRFPELALEPLSQEYRRLRERRYEYSSRGGAFRATLDVDDEGVVVDYEGIWQRVTE
jgi:uncharacterized protein